MKIVLEGECLGHLRVLRLYRRVYLLLECCVGALLLNLFVGLVAGGDLIISAID